MDRYNPDKQPFTMDDGNEPLSCVIDRGATLILKLKKVEYSNIESSPLTMTEDQKSSTSQTLTSKKTYPLYKNKKQT